MTKIRLQVGKMFAGSLVITILVAATFGSIRNSWAASPSIIGWNISEFQPNVREGGRANTIAVHPTNNDVILVASDTGGLFRSTDRGNTWRHVDSLPEFALSAVAFLPVDPHIVIVTTLEDFKVANGGGIWRSTNGGAIACLI